MKLNSAVSVLAVAAAFAVFLPPSNASAGVCFLPDCMDDEVVQGDINMNINSDTEYCEKEGYTYYSSGECPQYQAKVGTCSRDEHYLKCDAVKWCKDNGYNTQTCSLPSFVNGQCPNGKPYYKGCKEDRPRACREQGYVNSCSPGRLYATSNRCPWDNSYGKCCTASPSTGCPSNYKVTCDSSRGSSGRDTCGYTCYRCCNDECPSGTSKNYTGSYSTTTECGSRCNRCKTCPSGSSTSYTGSYAGTTECNGGQSCYRCNDTCRTGEKSVSCSSTYKKVRVSSTECGNSCYECQYNTDCSVTSKSCTYGCAYENSCGKCTSCRSNPDCSVSSKSCSNGCASYNSCNKCTSCNPEPSAQTVACTVGMVYNSDHTCTDGKATGKTPIGIVGYANSSGTSGLIFSIAKSSKCMKMCSTSVGNYKESCLLRKLSCLSSIGCTRPGVSDENGCSTHFDLEYNGKNNTQCMVNAGAVWEVANYCHNFSTAGTNAGEWYLPSIGEARRVFGENYKIVSAALNNVNGDYIGLQWTSTQTSASCTSGADYKMVSFDNPRNICSLNFSLGKSSCSYQRCVRNF